VKLLYLTDTHWRGTTPQGRLDDLPQTLLAKLREALDLARSCGATAILHGGDLFDRPDVAPAVALQFLRVLKEEAPCPVYAIAGNHDIFGFNPETVPRTMLGVLDGAQVIRLVRPGAPVFLETGGLTVQLTGQPFHAELDRRDPCLDYCVAPAGTPGAVHLREPRADFALHLTHGMLLERPFLDEVAHTLLAAVMDHTVADVTFGGHYHPGWGKVHEVAGRLFINPGALVRLGNQRADWERRVCVALVELQRGAPVRCELIPLASARAAEEVLDRSREAAQMARERALADFIMGIDDLSRFEVLAVQEIMREIAATKEMDGRVTAEALRRLGAAQEALAEGGEESP
jgi:DNA repair exonuclease SbcCD nuclease subunit